MNLILKILMRAVGYLQARLPRWLTWRLGWFWGSLAYYLLPVRRAVAEANIAKAFPDLTGPDRRRLLRATYRHFALVLLDFLAIPAWARRAPSVYHLDISALDSLGQNGQGAVVLTGHLGNWEMIVLAMGQAGQPFLPVVVKQRGGAEALVRDIRRATGCEVVPRKMPARQMLKLINAGKYLALAADQDARRKGIWVNFFGVPSSRFKGGATFHLSSGAPLFYARSILQPDHRYRIDFIPIPTDDLSGNKETDTALLIQRWMGLLEAEVRRHPEQYFWFHRLWKSKPPVA